MNAKYMEAYAKKWRKRERFYNTAYIAFFLFVIAIFSGFMYLQYLTLTR